MVWWSCGCGKPPSGRGECNEKEGHVAGCPVVLLRAGALGWGLESVSQERGPAGMARSATLSCWGLWNILTQSRAWTRAKDLSRNSKPCTKTTLDLEQMKGTVREFKERAYIPRWLLAGYFERRLGHAFLPASPRGLFQHSFSLLVYSRARGLGSLNMEIPAALGTALSQLGLLRSLFWWC